MREKEDERGREKYRGSTVVCDDKALIKQEKMNLNDQVQRRIFKALDQRLFQQRQTT